LTSIQLISGPHFSRTCSLARMYACVALHTPPCLGLPPLLVVSPPNCLG
jgi:hypothetical protein